MKKDGYIEVSNLEILTPKGLSLKEELMLEPLLVPVLELALKQNTISIGDIKEKFDVSFIRAAKIASIMEKRGFVSEPDGISPRKIFITQHQLEEMKNL